MGLSDYWSERRTKAFPKIGPQAELDDSFDGGYATDDGSDSASSGGGPSRGGGIARTPSSRCTSTSECASGYYCSNGTCLQSYPGSRGDGGSTSGCGDSQENNNTCGSNPTPAGGCTEGICGKKYGVNPGDDTCCSGEKCCERKPGESTVTCRCGACDPPKVNCDAFCAAHYVATGKLTLGCTEENICTQCEECRVVENFQPRECVRLDPENAYCWCPQVDPTPPEECQRCADNGIWAEDCENCQACYDIQVDCGCARATAKCCYPGCIESEGNQKCMALAWNTCYQACSTTDPDGPEPEPDPCAGNCYSQTFCDGPPPACPAGSSCTDDGTITAGGRTCYIRTVCDKTGVDSGCEEPECNCDADCGDCELCSAQGECKEDPDCEKEYRTTWKLTGEDYFVGTCAQQGDGTSKCNEDSVVLVPATDKFVTTICAPLPHSLLRVDNNTVTPVPGGECKTGNDRKEWRIVDANGTTISDLIVSSGPSGTWCLGPTEFREPEYQSASACS